MTPNYLALAAELADAVYDGLSDADAANAINQPDASRPILKPLSVAALMGLFAASSLQKLYLRPALVAFRDDAVKQDRAAVANWIMLAYVAGDVTESEKNAVFASLAETVPGPSRASVVFGSVVSEHEVAKARSL